MADYDVRAQEQAARQLAPKPKGKGQRVTLTYQPEGEYDPATGATDNPDPEIRLCSGIEESFEAYRIDGTNILTGDTRFMLSPVKTDGTPISLPDDLPETATLTLASGAVKALVRVVERVQPAGRLVYAVLQLRG